MKIFLSGIRDGIPIALGYYAVAFSLGIIAGNVGLDAFMGFSSPAPLPVNTQDIPLQEHRQHISRL